ncbi:MAG: hypothetical protein KY439_01605 [Actinobacteria bacterium]|nr:hypothetical protein [Actinomycetota bacterium]
MSPSKPDTHPQDHPDGSTRVVVTLPHTAGELGHALCGSGEEGLLATASSAQVLSEQLNGAVLRLYDFADWQLLNVTEAEATALDSELARLRGLFAELGRGVAAVVAEVDAWCARFGADWPEDDELFMLSMARLGHDGDPRWQALAAWWRSNCADPDDRGADVDETSAGVAAGVWGRG